MSFTLFFLNARVMSKKNDMRIVNPNGTSYPQPTTGEHIERLLKEPSCIERTKNPSTVVIPQAAQYFLAICFFIDKSN